MKLDRFLMTLVMVIGLVFFSGNSAFISVSAQQKPQSKPQCPVTRVSCPDSVSAKDSLTFNAQVSGGDQKVQPTYNWSVSAGTISSGQGTSSIQVDTSEVPGDSTITATAELGGFDRECGYGSTTSSCTTSILKKAEARKVDEYGKIKPDDANERLKNFAIELMSDPLGQGYIIAYNGRSSRATDAKQAASGAKNYLVTKLGLATDRVMTVDGGYREEPLTELWMVPSGAQPPEATPTLDPKEAKPATPAKRKPVKRAGK